MVDNDNKATDNEAPVPAQGTEPTSPDTPISEPVEQSPSPQTFGLWAVLLLTLLLTLALGAAGYWYYTHKQDNNQALLETQQNQQLRMAALDEENRRLQQQLASLESSKAELGQAVNELMATTESLRRQTELALGQINNLDGHRPSDWLLAEADYLVRMAGRKVWLEKDLRTARMLLQNADQRLKELDDPSVLPIRALIAQDIQTISQINPVSRTSVALALSGMISQVENLPVAAYEHQVDTGSQATSEVSDSVSDWQQNLLSVWDSLVEDFISVRRVDTPIEPVLDARQEFLLQEQLKLNLMQAQSAAIGAQAALYEQSLQSAMKIVIEQYDLQNSQVSGFVSSLQNLLTTDISESLPTELAAQKPLQDLVDARVKQAYGEGALSL
ncbi:heme biosynthesis operon protein HemX [Alteromonas aestuariivivens]|uniref:Heme biosynthesis operon protein HemX n=1 Tax=Alteromonas aestuariivivens TaxID=1938339 RepID=A0A3D8M6Y2_9ALTE|nr:uroporphyrinogen-III C-methyltransferase [Alteromonas aestuariivivens]RDV25478.1 heme biosynthesis operon protein HemX [Alteromonas aestuariivivens]